MAKPIRACTLELHHPMIQFLITMNILCPGKSYSKMYGTEPRYKDLRYNDIRGITMRIFPDITILSVHSHKLSKTLNLTQ